MTDKSPPKFTPQGHAAHVWDAGPHGPEMPLYWLSAIIDSADDAIISKTLDGIITSWNRGAQRIFGYTAEETVGRPVTILIPPERHDEEPAILARLRSGQRIEHYETVRVRKDGTRVDISLTVSPIRNGEGRIIGASKIARDITERRRAEESLRRSERELTDFFESAVVGLHWVGPDGRILRANRAELEMLGYAPDEYVGHHVAEFHEDSEAISDILRRLQSGEVLHEYEARLRCKDGSVRHVLIDSSVMWEGDRFVHTRCFTRDITERKLAEESRLRLAAIVESSDDAIVSKSLEGVILSWNAGAEKIFGYTPEEAVGRHISMLIPPERLHEEPRIIETIRRGERIEHYETVRVRKGGERIHISLTVSPVKDSSGRVIGVSKIARDITERVLAEEERARLLARERAARERAEEASRLKDEFLATVSHELRTPLTAILGWAHMLRTGQLDGEGVVRAYETIEKNSRAQAQLIDDMLDMSRIVTGKFRLDVRPVDPNTFVEAAVDSVRPAAEAKGVLLQKVADGAPPSVAGDPVRLQQVVWNLLSNAVKFTPRGGRVWVRLGSAGPHAEIVVGDTGSGIAPEFLPHVFDRFRQADGSITREHGGLGLGLSIVRHLVELHGGTVEAESPGEGRGSTFTVRLPVSPVYRESDSPPQLRPGEDGLSSPGALPERLDGLRILVVDDEPDTLEFLKLGLERCGGLVAVAASAGEALRELAESGPDLLVSDIGMPGEDGYELIRKVRALPAESGGRTPAIALTAYARSEDRLQALRAGYQMHVAKPIELSELAAVAASLARRDR